MSNEVDKNENRPLYYILGFLIVIIIAISAALIGININKNTVAVESYKSIAQLDYEISESLKYDPDFETNDAVVIYEEEIQKGDDDRRIEVAVSYSNFVNDTMNDTNRAIEIIKSIEPIAKSDMQLGTFYATLLKFYEIQGNTEGIAKCNKILKELEERTPKESIQGNAITTEYYYA